MSAQNTETVAAAMEDGANPYFGVLNASLARMVPEWFGRQTKRDLHRCGYSHPVAHENYLAIRNVAMFGCILALVIWIIALDDQPAIQRWTLILGAVSTILLATVPRVVISTWGESRLRRITHGFPDALDLMSMGLTGGLSFQQSLLNCARELENTHRDLAFELQLISRQATAGSLSYAIRRFQDRMDWPELRSVTEPLLHAVELGVSLRESLEQLSDQLRDERMRRLNERANRNSILMLLPIVFCLAPTALIIIFMPPLLKLKDAREKLGRDRSAASSQLTK